MKNQGMQFAPVIVVLLIVSCWTAAHAQITPSGDAYINTGSPTTHYGTAVTLGVVSPSETTFIAFDLSSIPAGYTGSRIAKATLKFYVSSVTTAGSFNVDLVNGSWTEATLTANNAPALGATIAASIPLSKSQTHDYVLIDITQALQDWLNGTPNDGIALVANSPLSATFESKENTGQSHPAELDIVFSAIAGVNTAAGSGLTGGGTGGTLNLSLTTSCATNQMLQWNGSAWVCTAAGTGTITGVTAGTDLTGGGISGNVTLNLDTTKVPLLAANNIFTVAQSFTGGLFVTYGNFNGLASVNNSPQSPTIYAENTAPTGEAWGVEGVTDSSAGNAYGVYGLASSVGIPIGVYGLALSAAGGTGVFGQVGSESTAGKNLFANVGGVGAWGDGGVSTGTRNVGVAGTIDDGWAGYFENNSPNGYDTVVIDSATLAAPFVTYGPGGSCAADANGNLSCTGTKNAMVPVDGGKRAVALSAIESPVNWFEDAGSAQLVNGVAVVELDPTFTQTVNTEMAYRVFTEPNGDCKGLYVTNKTATSFEVHELAGGTSSIAFDYRIMALRKNYESVRFDDRTRMMEHMNQMRERMKAGAGHPVSHDPAKKSMPAPASMRAAAERTTVAR